MTSTSNTTTICDSIADVPTEPAGGCKVPGCAKDHHARGMCGTHYARWARTGDPLTERQIRSINDRLHDKLELDEATGCIVWTGKLTPQRKRNGVALSRYGALTGIDGRRHYAHRLAYEEIYGPIPAGLEIDHLCRNTKCCNPQHLEAVTHKENVRRGMSPAAMTAHTGECGRGHNWEENRVFSGGHYRCRLCHNAASLRYKNRVKARQEIAALTLAEVLDVIAA